MAPAERGPTEFTIRKQKMGSEVEKDGVRGRKNWGQRSKKRGLGKESGRAFIREMDWSSRPARISRLKEKTHFDQVVMPLAWAGAVLGLIALFWQGLEWMEDHPTIRAVWIPALFFFLLPFPLVIYRWLRKHYHRKLHA